MISSAVQRHYYRNGQLREEAPLRKGRMHGTVRTWHKNGVLASEEPYRAGLLHGVCRQWDEAGRLLGKFKMVHGTGIQRTWHDNGRMQLEVSTVRGEFSGRNRLWLRDGTLILGVSAGSSLDYLWRSGDRGKTWESEQILSLFPQQLPGDLYARPLLLSDGQDRLWVIWVGLRSGESALYLSRSTDGGSPVLSFVPPSDFRRVMSA